MATRVGILECDHVDQQLLAATGEQDYTAMFSSLLDIDLVPYDAINGVLPDKPDECDAWIATGSRFSVYDDVPWIHELSQFVRDIHAADVPYAGICFGHQLLGHALGGRVEKRGWNVGAIDTELRGEEKVLLYMHQDQITALPDGAEVLGRNATCEIAAIRIGSMLGVQAHPEFTVEYVDALLDERVERIGAAATARAKKSLSRACDSARVGAWIKEFLA